MAAGSRAGSDTCSQLRRGKYISKSRYGFRCRGTYSSRGKKADGISVRCRKNKKYRKRKNTEKTKKTNTEKEKFSEVRVATPSEAGAATPSEVKKPESTKLPEISEAVIDTGSLMYADAVEDDVYTISPDTGGFSISGGTLTDKNVTTLTEAVKEILAQSETKKVAIHFDNIVSSENNGIELDTPCELTLTGSYTGEALFNIKSTGCFTIHNTADITTSEKAITNSKNAEVIFEHNGGTLESTGGQIFFLKTADDKIYLKNGMINGTVFGNKKDMWRSPVVSGTEALVL